MYPEFPGKDTLVKALDAAVAIREEHAVGEALRKTLSTLIRERCVQLPDVVQSPVDGHYARRELYVSPDYGYSVVAMTWGPRQGTQIHDHAGAWCVEGVWQGQLEITQYELAETSGKRYRFTSSGAILADAGSAGALIPPHEYHTICNNSDSEVAISLHIYKNRLNRCGIYLIDEASPGWTIREDRTIDTDALPADLSTH